MTDATPQNGQIDATPAAADAAPTVDLPDGAPVPTDFWAKSYGASNNDTAHAVVREAAGGGYAVAGYRYSDKSGVLDNDAWLLRLDGAGDPLWQLRYGVFANDKYEAWFALEPTTTGGWIAAGATVSFGAGADDAWVVALADTGGLLWQRSFGGAATDVAHAILVRADGGYYVAGYTSSAGAGDYDGWVLALAADGAVEWEQSYGGTDSDIFVTLAPAADGGFLALGTTRSFGAGGADYLFVCGNPDGSVRWARTYGGVLNDWPRAVTPVRPCDPDDDICADPLGPGWIAVGETWVNDAVSGLSDAMLLRLDESGAPLWMKHYGSAKDEVGNAVVQTGDGTFAFAGSTDEPGHLDFTLASLGGDGDLRWQRRYGGAGFDSAVSMAAGAGGFALAGPTWSWGAGFIDYWVVKTAPDGSAPPVDAVTTFTAHDADWTVAVAPISTGAVHSLAVDTTAALDATTATVQQQAP
jgi:hypothetical protein